MPATVSWYTPHHIILVRSYGAMVMQDFVTGGERILAHVDSSSACCVHVLMDETQVTSIPNNIRALRRATSWMNHPRVGWAVSYGNDMAVVHLAANIVTEMAGVHYRRTKHLASALDILLHHNPELSQHIETHH